MGFAKQFEPESTMTCMEKKIQDAKDAAAAEGKELSQAQIFELMKDSMDAESKKKMDQMLKSGMPLDEVIEHFLKKGKTMEQMMEGKNLNEDEVLALMRSQVDEETKKEIAAMLAKGYSKQDVINHLMKTMKTDEEKDREAVKKLQALFNDQDMSEEEKVNMLGKQLNSEDQAQMEEMLKNGCSIEEVMGHFMS